MGICFWDRKSKPVKNITKGRQAAILVVGVGEVFVEGELVAVANAPKRGQH